jgi:2-iminobutanoate/2-iminopropanoate deaminase
MTSKTIINTDAAPAAIGPYSQAVRSGDLLFCSGQLGLVPATGQLAEGVEAQTRQAMENIMAVLATQGAGFDTIVKTTIFVADLADFATVNAVYGGYFTDGFPARSTVQVAGLPKGGLVEIEVTARLG